MVRKTSSWQDEERRRDNRSRVSEYISDSVVGRENISDLAYVHPEGDWHAKKYPFWYYRQWVLYL